MTKLLSLSFAIFCLGLLTTAHAAEPLLQLAMKFEAISETSAEDGFPVIIQRSNHGYQQTVENIRRSILGNNFRLIRQQYLDTGFKPEAQVSDRETVIYFCNFNMVNQALNMDKRVGQLLPCRVTVVERQEQVFVMAANPKLLSTTLNNPALEPVCEQITAMYKTIINEAIF